MADLLELAERCEKAAGPDPQLDAEIWCVVFAPAGSYVERSKINGAWCIYDGVNQRTARPRLWEASNSHVLPVTESVDAAMALTRGLRGLSLLQRSNPDMGGKDWIVSAGSNRSAARSWPLALCAVGLRARASRPSNHSKGAM